MSPQGWTLPPCRSVQCKAHRRTRLEEFDARRMYWNSQTASALICIAATLRLTQCSKPPIQLAASVGSLAVILQPTFVPFVCSSGVSAFGIRLCLCCLPILPKKLSVDFAADIENGICCVWALSLTCSFMCYQVLKILNCSQLRLAQEIAVVLHQCVCLMLCLQQYRWSRAKSVCV